MFKCEKCLGWFRCTDRDGRSCWRTAMLLGWREVNGMRFCGPCFSKRLPSERVGDRRTVPHVRNGPECTCPNDDFHNRRGGGGHPLYGHRTEWRPDDSVWCFDCGGIVAVADG